jgi:hypothetical protein
MDYAAMSSAEYYLGCADVVAHLAAQIMAFARDTAAFTWLTGDRMMPAINFHRDFVEAVTSGRKRSTIRKRRQRTIKVGDTLSLYTGQRTVNVEKLGDVVCRAIRTIQITEYSVHINGLRLTLDQIECVARNDGFADVSAFLAWFRDHYGLPFEGVEIIW